MVVLEFQDKSIVKLKPSLYTMRLFKEKYGHDIAQFDKVFGADAEKDGGSILWNLIAFVKCSLMATLDLDGSDKVYSDALIDDAIGNMAMEDMKKVVKTNTDIPFFKSILKMSMEGNETGEAKA